MTRRPFTRLLFPILILLLAMTFGCGTTKSVIQKIKPEKAYLKKKIMVLPPIDLSGLPAGKAAQTTADLVEILKQSPQLAIYTPPEGWSLPKELKRPDFGVAYYNPAIAEVAKKYNMNALMAAFLPLIETSKGRAGVWPLRYDADIYKISIVINVMDVTNGCLYMTDYSSKEVVFRSDEIDGLTKEEIFEEIMIQGMPDILENQASKVMKELEEAPWTGRILDEKNGLLTINAGNDAGVLPDQVFTVYSQGESIACMSGRNVALMGEKIGRIKITSVMEDHALAAPVIEDHALADPEMEDHALADPEMEDHALAAPVMEDHALADPEMEDHTLADPEMEDHALADPEMEDHALAAPEDKRLFSVGQTIVFNPDPED
jgi:hypothetical protein